MKSKNSKGFFLVLIAFILIMYIFTYLTAWISALEISERTASEKFKAANIEGIVSQLNEKNFIKFFEISGYYALFKINDYSSNNSHTLQYNKSDEVQYLRSAFFGMILNGSSADFDGNSLEYNSDENQSYTFYAWLDKLNYTLSHAGLNITQLNISDMKFNQTSPITFNASMNLSIFVKDRLSTLSINRSFTLKKEFNITGFPDPMIRREIMKLQDAGELDMTVEKQIFYRDNLTSSLAPIRKANGTYGMGFFYGPMVNANNANLITESERSRYILVGNFTEITSMENYTNFSAYILTDKPEEIRYDGCELSEENIFMELIYKENTAGNCEQSDSKTKTNKPFAVFPNFNMNDFTGPNGNYSLIIANASVAEVTINASNKSKGVAIYDIENLRDATVCAYFLPSTHAPSYPQRLSQEAVNLSSNFGMQTLLVGKWAGGENLTAYENYSRVDFEFFNRTQGIKIRGMPGCKNLEMCSASAGSGGAPLGQFRLSLDSLKEYGIITDCKDGRAGCE